MLKRKLCEVSFTWELKCPGPLLIADGRYEQPEKGENEKGKYPDKLFISRNPRQDLQNSTKLAEPENLTFDFYVPGTSLRGPFRAQAERIIRSLLPADARVPITACIPLDDANTANPQSCSRRMDQEKQDVPYAAACPACKLFGCTGTASRIVFTDGELQPGFSSTYREMVGIDRFTGGVGAGPMKFHVLENAKFSTRVTVTNFELWQLGLLAYVFRDFKEGLVPIGFGKTKGFGTVYGEVRGITFTYPKGKTAGKSLQDLGSLASPEEQERYQFNMTTPEFQTAKLGSPTSSALSLYDTFEVQWAETEYEVFWEAMAGVFNEYIEQRTTQVSS